jgi:glycosyltransferase involved in cell wall biosynthesis
MTEVIRDGENGLIVPAGDHRALAGAVARILRDVELATSLGKRGYRDAHTHYSWDRIAEQVLNEYRRLLRGSSGQDSLDLPNVPKAAS